MILEKSVGGLTVGDLLTAVLIVLAGAAAIRIASRFAARALEKSKLEKGLQSFIRSFMRVGLWAVVILIAGEKLGVRSATLVAALSVAGLALSLSLQGILENLFSGFTILFTRPFVSGDYVELDGIEGTVSSIRLFYTTLITYDKKKVFIPNSKVVASRITNSTNEPLRRVDRVFSLGYDCPTDKVRRALLEAARADVRILEDPPPEVRLTAYQASNIDYTLVAWVQNGDYWGVYYGLNESARDYLEAAGLSMSYSRVDVRLTDR